MDYWKGKIAVVTGASSGIGAQILLDLAKSEVITIGLARRKERIEQLAVENPQSAPFIHAHACDVSSIDSITAAFKWIEENFDKVHIMINNAGTGKRGNILSETVLHSDIAHTVNTNLTGLVTCTREAYKLMQKHEELCYIININSITGHITPQQFFSGSNIYSATKCAITNHTEFVRLDLANAGVKRVRVSSISPGIIKTEIALACGYSQEESDALYSGLPCLMPEDVSNAVLYLLSLPENVNITELTIKPTGEIF